MEGLLMDGPGPYPSQQPFPRMNERLGKVKNNKCILIVVISNMTSTFPILFHFVFAFSLN
jgi:hypothetical protein